MTKLILLLVILATFSLAAQDSVPDPKWTYRVESPSSDENDSENSVTVITFPEEAVDSIEIIKPNNDLGSRDVWQTVMLKGKLKAQGLPLSPSLNIFMSRDSLIDISIRAPFVGEAARIAISNDSILLVNKMQKTFAKEGIAEILQYYPGTLSDIQNLLLAKVFIPGFDLSITPVEEIVDFYPTDNNQFNIVPREEAQIPGIKYGFVVDQFFNPVMLLILPENRPDIEISASYSYPSADIKQLIGFIDSPYSILLSISLENTSREASFEFKTPEWNAMTPKPLELSKKFRQLSLSDFIRSF